MNLIGHYYLTIDSQPADLSNKIVTIIIYFIWAVFTEVPNF